MRGCCFNGIIACGVSKLGKNAGMRCMLCVPCLCVLLRFGAGARMEVRMRMRQIEAGGNVNVDAVRQERED